MQEDHENCPPEFQMKVSGYQMRPLDRQTEEASKIEEFNGHKYLNRRGEWGQNLPPRLTIEGESPETGAKRKRPGKMAEIQDKERKNEPRRPRDDTETPESKHKEYMRKYSLKPRSGK